MLAFSSCSKEPGQTPSGKLEIVFKARYGDQALVYGQEYDYFGVGKIIFGSAEFFLSNMTLVNSTDSAVFAFVDYISLAAHHTSPAKAEEGLRITYDAIPTGQYSEIKMNLGLTPEQNNSKPEEFQSAHPMSDGSRYWSGWNSYIFTKTEGTFKSTGNYNFTYHSGFDESMRTLKFTKSILIKQGETSQIEIDVDYKTLFDLGGVGLDISVNPQIHNKSDIMSAFVDRFQLAASIK